MPNFENTVFVPHFHKTVCVPYFVFLTNCVAPRVQATKASIHMFVSPSIMLQRGGIFLVTVLTADVEIREVVFAFHTVV